VASCPFLNAICTGQEKSGEGKKKKRGKERTRTRLPHVRTCLLHAPKRGSGKGKGRVKKKNKRGEEPVLLAGPWNNRSRGLGGGKERKKQEKEGRKGKKS